MQSDEIRRAKAVDFVNQVEIKAWLHRTSTSPSALRLFDRKSVYPEWIVELEMMMMMMMMEMFKKRRKSRSGHDSVMSCLAFTATSLPGQWPKSVRMQWRGHKSADGPQALIAPNC